MSNPILQGTGNKNWRLAIGDDELITLSELNEGLSPAVLASPDGSLWSLSVINEQITASPTTYGSAGRIYLISPNRTAWELTIDNNGIFTYARTTADSSSGIYLSKDRKNLYVKDMRYKRQWE